MTLLRTFLAAGFSFWPVILATCSLSSRRQAACSRWLGWFSVEEPRPGPCRGTGCRDYPDPHSLGPHTAGLGVLVDPTQNGAQGGGGHQGIPESRTSANAQKSLTSCLVQPSQFTDGETEAQTKAETSQHRM